VQVPGNETHVLAQDTCSVLGELAGERQLNHADCRRRVAYTATTEGTLRGSVQGLVLAQHTCSVLGELAGERQ